MFSSVLLLTILLAIGLAFFLRAASKDRTTVLEMSSPKPPLEVLNGISFWLEQRGWKSDGGDINKQILRFTGVVEASLFLTILLSIFAGLGSACLGLVLRQLYPAFEWWPLLLVVLGSPIAALFYRRKATREEVLELRLIEEDKSEGITLRLRAHRDELIAMELELSKTLDLASDGSLLSSPI